MKIGLVTFDSHLDSVRGIWRMTMSLLAREHELISQPARRFLMPAEERQKDLERWLSCCNLILGPISDEVLNVRKTLARPLPYVCLLLGSLSRGAGGLSTTYKLLRTSDVLLGNCASDVALATQFFPNSTAMSVPFAYDDTAFYRSDALTRKRARSLLAIGETDRVLLYAGRIGLEKNLHSLLTLFRVIVNAVPDSYLLIAGKVGSESFPEFGGSTVDLMRVLRRLRTKLKLDGRVMFLGPREPEDLRALYSTSDLLVNLTLHHDENFGLSQVEAMACGLPAIGTTWGGLKDTIIDGVTGAHIPARVTAAGVKVDWWRAADVIVRLLRSERQRQLAQEECIRLARECYSPTRYVESFTSVFNECVSAAASLPASPLEPSRFAQALWKERESRRGRQTSYRRSEQAYALYRQLVTPYALSQNGAHVEVASTWCLGSPLRFRSDTVVVVNDLLYPFEISVPPPLAPTVRALTELLAEEPVLMPERVDALEPDLRAALDWMHEAGLVLRTHRGTLDPDCTRGTLANDWFNILPISESTDLVSFS